MSGFLYVVGLLFSVYKGGRPINFKISISMVDTPLGRGEGISDMMMNVFYFTHIISSHTKMTPSKSNETKI